MTCFAPDGEGLLRDVTLSRRRGGIHPHRDVHAQPLTQQTQVRRHVLRVELPQRGEQTGEKRSCVRSGFAVTGLETWSVGHSLTHARTRSFVRSFSSFNLRGAAQRGEVAACMHYGQTYWCHGMKTDESA